MLITVGWGYFYSYRKQELTLRGLAAEVDIPAHLISQIINEQTEAGFIHFINQYQVQEAIEKLTDARQQHISVVQIGKQVGFNSKPTFYVAFKKYTTVSPGDFRIKI